MDPQAYGDAMVGAMIALVVIGALLGGMLIGAVWLVLHLTSGVLRGGVLARRDRSRVLRRRWGTCAEVAMTAEEGGERG